MAPPDWDTYSPDSSPDGEPARPASPQRPKPPKRPKQPKPQLSWFARQSVGKRRLVFLAGLAVVLVPIYAVVAVAADDGDGFVGIGGPSNAQTADGFDELLDDLRDEVGNTEVFEVVIYPKYAVVDVPYKKDDEREVSYYWDGGLSESTKGTSDYVPFDLATIDGDKLDDLCDQVKALVEDPGDCYLIIRRPGEASSDGWLWAYTSNEFSQGGYINFDLEGNEVNRSTW